MLWQLGTVISETPVRRFKRCSPISGVRNLSIYIDFVEFFSYSIYGEFLKGVHRNPLIRVEAATYARIILSVFF